MNKMTHLQTLFIKNIRTYRTAQGYSQLEFSEKIGISPNYFNAVENGKNFPSPEVLQKIIDTLEIMPYQLFLESPVNTVTPTSPLGSEEKQKIVNLKESVVALFDKVLGEQMR